MKAIYAESAAMQTLLEECACGLKPEDADAVAREALRYISEDGAWARGTSARPACEIMAEAMVLNDDAIVRSSAASHNSSLSPCSPSLCSAQASFLVGPESVLQCADSTRSSRYCKTVVLISRTLIPSFRIFISRRRT